MTVVSSTMVSLGFKAPDFRLRDSVTGREMSLGELKGEIGTLVMFICNHCPYVKHVNPELARLARDFSSKGISFIAISANDPERYPEDRPERMKEVAKSLSYHFPYLFDETQDVARAYHAACTPDFFLFDFNLKLIYRGQLDDSRPGNGLDLTGLDLRRALDCMLLGKPIPQDQKPSMGCSIKWKK